MFKKCTLKIGIKKIVAPIVAFFFITLSNAQQYQEDWVSLRKHQTPSWLTDAKFGIYSHWGIWTIKYQKGNENLTNDEAIALFKADKFNADDWAALYAKAGAKFGGVIAWHGSDYLHWDSQFSNYNSVKLSPHIDIVKEVSTAMKKKGLKTVTTYHSIGDNPDWFNFAKEGVDTYDPDLFWVDASFGGTKEASHKKLLHNSKYIGTDTASVRMLPEKYQRKFITYFYNQALAKGKEVEFIYKSNDIPPGVAMRDLENGLLPETAYDPWMVDLDMSLPPDFATHGWFYRDGIPLRTSKNLVNVLMDVISKNGILLLNIPPLADGSFNEEVQHTMTELGAWLTVNGEAVYGTSPWFIFGEGPTEIPVGNYNFHHNDHFGKLRFSPKDIRFTAKGNTLYATCLGKPDQNVLIKSLNASYKLKKEEIASITHLGSKQALNWKHDANGLEIILPEKGLTDLANVFKIELNY